MKLAYRTCAYKTCDVAGALRHMAGVGYEGVELCLENAEISPAALTDEKIGEVKGVLAETGLGISSVSLHAPIVYDDGALDRVRQGIAIARKFDCDVFVACSGPGRGEDRKDEKRRLLGRVAQLMEACDRHNVFLAIEPEPKFIVDSSADMKDLMDEIGSDYLRVNLDIGHAFITDADVCESIRILGDRIVHTHVEDISASKEHKHLLPGAGAIDFKAVVAALRSAGFDGYLTVDLFNLDPMEAAQPALDVLRRATA